jgi:hypothetical protein
MSLAPIIANCELPQGIAAEEARAAGIRRAAP